jgi:hypothetical protein
VFLIQFLLPTRAGDTAIDDGLVARTRDELISRFGGVTAYLRTPAHGVWTSPEGRREHDDVVMVEVVTADFDRSWWREYSASLARRFVQETIHVRALRVEVLERVAT